MKIFQQDFIHYDRLNNLRQVENKFFLKFYRNFVQEFANKQNVKEHNIINSLNIVKKSFDNLMIIEDDKTKKRYRTDDDKKYMNLNKYKKDDEVENEYEKNQKNEENESDNDNNDDEDIIMTKVIELSDRYNLINSSELNKRMQYAYIIITQYYLSSHL